MSQSLCETCIHFIHQKRGPHGGLRGVCESSNADMHRYDLYKTIRSVGSKEVCARYQEAEDGKCKEM